MTKYITIIFLAIVLSIAAVSCTNSNAAPASAICPYDGKECPHYQEALEYMQDKTDHDLFIEKHIISITINERGLIDILYDQYGDRYELDNLKPERFEQ